MKLDTSSVDALIAGAVGIAANALTSKEDKELAFRLAFAELQQRATVGQLEVNAVEAASPHWFVAGWRPGVGWVCLTAFCLNFVAFPCIASIAVYYSAFTGENVDLSGLPRMNMTEIMPVLFGLLGMGGLRTIEKTLGTK